MLHKPGSMRHSRGSGRPTEVQTGGTVAPQHCSPSALVSVHVSRTKEADGVALPAPILPVRVQLLLQRRGAGRSGGAAGDARVHAQGGLRGGVAQGQGSDRDGCAGVLHVDGTACRASRPATLAACQASRPATLAAAVQPRAPHLPHTPTSHRPAGPPRAPPQAAAPALCVGWSPTPWAPAACRRPSRTGARRRRTPPATPPRQPPLPAPRRPLPRLGGPRRRRRPWP